MSALLRALQAQPYRQGAVRPEGPALDAMLAGRPLGAPNPQDAMRALQRKTALSDAFALYRRGAASGAASHANGAIGAGLASLAVIKRNQRNFVVPDQGIDVPLRRA